MAMMQLREQVTELELLMGLGEYFKQQEFKKSKILRHTDVVQLRSEVESLSEKQLTEFVKEQLAKD